MIFGKGECRRTGRTSNENLPKRAKIAAFWQGPFYSCLAYGTYDAIFSVSLSVKKVWVAVTACFHITKSELYNLSDLCFITRISICNTCKLQKKYTNTVSFYVYSSSVNLL